MKNVSCIITILAILSWLTGVMPPVQVVLSAQANDSDQREFVSPDWLTYVHPETGLLRFLSLPPGEAIPHSEALAHDAPPETAARDFLRRYGELFGVQDPDRQLTVMKIHSLPGDSGTEARRSFV